MENNLFCGLFGGEEFQQSHEQVQQNQFYDPNHILIEDFVD
jgi:hypothetical protein